jgi:hypothetical protein
MTALSWIWLIPTIRSSAAQAVAVILPLVIMAGREFLRVSRCRRSPDAERFLLMSLVPTLALALLVVLYRLRLAAG